MLLEGGIANVNSFNNNKHNNYSSSRSYGFKGNRQAKKRYRLNYYDTELKKNIEVQFETDTENKAINKGKKILDKKKYRNPGLYEMGEGEF